MNTFYYGDNLNILRRNGGNTRGSKCVPVPQASTGAAAGDTLPTGRVSAFCDNVLFKDESGLEADSPEWLSEDTWHWKGAASTDDDLIMTGDKVSEMLQAPALLHRRKPDDGLSRDDGRPPKLGFDERL